jgi:hypothetical protein
MTPLEEFQRAYGAEWAEIVRSRAFGAALSLASTEKLKEVAGLSDTQIANQGAVLLADLRGFLQYENGLLGLHEKKPLVFSPIGPPTYPDPITEALQEAQDEGKDDDDEVTPAPVVVAPVVRRPRKKSPKGKKSP